jgi:methionine aminopeptidase
VLNPTKTKAAIVSAQLFLSNVRSRQLIANPRILCASATTPTVNEVMVHGIPDSRPLQQGDIVNVDVTAFYEGMHADTSATFAVGQISDTGEHLVHASSPPPVML